MRLGISHIVITITDLARSRHLYVDGIGFEVLSEGRGYLDLEAGGVGVRLFEARGERQRTTLRLQTTRVGEAVARFLGAGAELIRPAARTGALELEAEVADPDGNRLLLWRKLQESELDFIPELAISCDWSPAALARMLALLARVPETFRDVARRDAVREAEHLARQDRRVEEEHAVRAYVRATPRMMRERLRQPLIDEGLRPDDYRDDFAC